MFGRLDAMYLALFPHGRRPIFFVREDTKVQERRYATFD